jgi:hypothetical protein
MVDWECVRADMIDKLGWRRSGEEDIDVTANDLTMAVKDRIERGLDFGIVGGGCDTIGDSDKAYSFAEVT